MASLDPATILKVAANFTARRPQKIWDSISVEDVTRACDEILDRSTLARRSA